TFTVSTSLAAGAHTYAEAGTFTTTTVVSDRGGARVSRTQTIAVADAALSGGVAVPVVASEDQLLVNVPVAIFVDANPGATAADIVSSINWGDSSSSTGAVTRLGSTAAGAAIFQVSGSHIYTGSVGSPFTITVSVADEDNSSNALTILSNA